MFEPTSLSLWIVAALPVAYLAVKLKFRDEPDAIPLYNFLFTVAAVSVSLNSIYFVITSGNILTFDERLTALFHVLPAVATYLLFKMGGDEKVEKVDRVESTENSSEVTKAPAANRGCKGLFRDGQEADCDPDTFVIDRRIEREIDEFIALISLAGKTGEKERLDLPRGMLIQGPPGTGKTTLGRMIPRLAHARCVTLCIDVLKTRIGKAHDAIDQLLEELDDRSAAVVLLDELDLCAKSRAEVAHADGDDTLSFLLHMLERVHSTRRIFVIATTSRPELIDEAVLRPGRFDRVLKTALPGEDQRVKILSNYLERSRYTHSIEPVGYVKVTEGMSGAEIKSVVTNAHTLALLEATEESREAGNIVIGDGHLSESIIRVVGERQKAA